MVALHQLSCATSREQKLDRAESSCTSYRQLDLLAAVFLIAHTSSCASTAVPLAFAA
jgi:hypothetical protein